MVGIKKDATKTARMQMNIGVIVNKAKAIHEKTPENDVDLKAMVRAIGRAIDLCLESEPKRPLEEVMIEKIFDEK